MPRSGEVKSVALESLARELSGKFGTKDPDSVWLFPPGVELWQGLKTAKKIGRCVKGFLGTGERAKSKDVVMLIAERPATTNQGKPQDRRYEGKKGDMLRRFYDVLAGHDLGNAHLTDFIKTRAKVGYDRGPDEALFYETEFQDHLPYLKQEIGIVKPTVVVAIGQKSWRWLAVCKSLIGLENAKLIYAPHYANRFKGSEFEERFLDSLRKGEIPC